MERRVHASERWHGERRGWEVNEDTAACAHVLPTPMQEKKQEAPEPTTYQVTSKKKLSFWSIKNGLKGHSFKDSR
jgi:hypothetical protein